MIIKRFIDVPMFNQSIFVWVTNSDDINDIKDDPEFPKGLKNSSFGSASTLYQIESGTVIMFFKKTSTIIDVLHEAIHAYTFMLQSRDIETDLSENEEVHAYILSWFQSEVLNLFHHIKGMFSKVKKKIKDEAESETKKKKKGKK